MRIDLYNDGSYNVNQRWGHQKVDLSLDFPYPRNPGWGKLSPASKNAYLNLDPNSVGRTVKDAERVPFIWKTHKGQLYLLEDMATPHLIHAINMIWRNVFGLKEDHPEIMSEWASIYVDTALLELTTELQRRVEDA